MEAEAFRANGKRPTVKIGPPGVAEKPLSYKGFQS
jgi:hypothetical protein